MTALSYEKRCLAAGIMRHFDKKHGQALRKYLAGELSDFARGYLESGLSGDADAAFSLFLATPNEYRGILAVAAYLLDVPNPGYREILRHAWDHDHLHLLDAVRDCFPSDRRRGVSHLRRMFKQGGFPVPLSGRIAIHRGHVHEKLAKGGLAWTTSFDVACHFALYRPPAVSGTIFGGSYMHEVTEDHIRKSSLQPMVVTAEIDAADIIFWSDERGEQEVITGRQPKIIAVEQDMAILRAGVEKMVAVRVAEEGNNSLLESGEQHWAGSTWAA